MTKTIFFKCALIILVLLMASFALSIPVCLRKTPQKHIKSSRVEINRTEIDRGETITPQVAPALMLADNYSYRQDDPIWASDKIGATSDSLGHFGCTIASVSVAASNLLGTEITPEDMNTRLSDVNGFTNRGWLVWKHVETATDGQIRAALDPKPSHEAINQCMLADGYPVIKIKLGGEVIHWVVIVGRADNDYLIRDPLVGTAKDEPIQLSSRSENIYASRCVTLNSD